MEAEESSSDGSAVNVKIEKTSDTKPYEVNSMILCSHTDNLFYEAKIIAAVPQPDGDYMYTVHYQGWSKRYDENIPHSRISSRFRPFTPENIEQAKAEMKEAKARAAEQSAKKKKLQKAENRRGRRTSHGTSDLATSVGSNTKLSVSQSVSRDSSADVLSRSPSTSEVTTIPEKLKNFLINDRRMIQAELKLPRLPSSSSVSVILREYAAYVRKVDAVCSDKVQKGRMRYWKDFVAAQDECSDNMKNYFDLLIESDLLYPNEKLRHKDLTEGPTKVMLAFNRLSDLLNGPKDGLRASEYYGFIYLLRLLSKFQEIIPYVSYDKGDRRILIVFTQSFIRFLGQNSEKFYSPEQDYEPVTQEYRNRLTQNA